MRSQKLLIVSATMLACTSLATASFADDTKTSTTKGNDTSSSSTTGASSVTSQTVMTPSSPTVPTTSTTVTTQGSTTPSTATIPPATPPATSTTTTTSADDVSASSAMPTGSMTSQPTGESTTVYAKRVPNKAVLITGTSLLVGTYVTTAALAGGNGGIGDRDLYIPIVGPWINIAERTPSQYSNNQRDTLLIAGSGVLQGIGALMTVASFFVPEKIPAARISAGNVKMELTPTAGAGSGGLGAIGTF